MRFLTGSFCEANVRNAFVLQQQTFQKRLPVVFAFVQEDLLNEDWEGDIRLLERWFYEEAFPVCTEEKLIKSINKVRKGFCRKADGLKGDFAAVFILGQECFWAWRGRVEIHLLNLCFNRLHRKRLNDYSPKLCTERAQIEEGVGILLGTADFFAHVTDVLLKECLDVDALQETAAVERHLREAASLTLIQGAFRPAVALLIGKKQDAQRYMPLSRRNFLARQGYEVGEWIGGGAFGQVYRVWDYRREKLLACKVACGLQGRRVLGWEAMLQKQISHPLFPSYADCLTEEDCTMLLMEYAEGECLAKRLQRGPLTPQRAIAVAKQLAEGLDYLHRLPEPVLYRDLKPENICITKKGKVYLMDLGCACILQAATDTQAGTLGYAPKEQLCNGTNADGLTPGFYSDVYGLGKIMHYMLTGDNPCKPPYQKPPIRAYHRKYSPELEQVIMQCVEESPKNRPADMQIVLKKLHNLPENRL